jgi:branched-chain amino acid aminotransferase
MIQEHISNNINDTPVEIKKNSAGTGSFFLKELSHFRILCRIKPILRAANISQFQEDESMAGFEGIKWASKQMRFQLKDNKDDILDMGSSVPAVSRSTHYGMFLAFEGIRFFCLKTGKGLKVNFFNLHKNLERFQRSMSFNLSREQQSLIPSVEKLETLFRNFFQDREIKSFLTETAGAEAPGYFRPFTYDEDVSIGVSFPQNPVIRAVICRYDRYLGEPFAGVVVPNLVRAVGINGTGCLKLSVNYLISIKAVDAARAIDPEAGSALFLDDRPYDPVMDRQISEWDTSCCLFALRDNTVVKIPESNLILPSVTIQGICALLRDMQVNVEERAMTYGELVERSAKNEIIAICSVGSAGILNRARRLVLVGEDGRIIGEQHEDRNHPLYAKLEQARTRYWNIYREKHPVPEGFTLNSFKI